MTEASGGKEAGFTLIELLLVVGMLGLVVGAIYGTYLANQKTAVSQGEVVEVQQNLRVALDCLARDIKMAGVLVPFGTTPVAAASGTPPFPNYSTSILINTASAEGRFARVQNTLTVAGAPTEITLDMELPGNAGTPSSLDGFAAGDKLRLLRAVDGSQPLSGIQTLKVTGGSGNPGRADFGSTPPTPPQLTVSKSDGVSTFSAGDVVHAGDMMAKVADETTFPMTVGYFLVSSGTTVNGFTCPERQKCLVRQVNGAASDIVATHISSLRFSYLDDSYHEAAAPPALSAIRAIRIGIEGTTAKTVGLAGPRIRGVGTVVKLRNRR